MYHELGAAHDEVTGGGLHGSAAARADRLAAKWAKPREGGVEFVIPRGAMEPAPPKVPKGFKEKDNAKRLIVILEHASLETVKVSNANLIARSVR